MKRISAASAVLLAGFLALALALAWRSRAWPLVHDAPIMHYLAWRIGEGAVPYRDLFDMNFPGVYLVHLAVLKLLGAGDGAWRLFDLAWLLIASLAVAALAAPWGGVAAAGGALFFATYHLAGGAWQAGQRDFVLCPFLLAGALGVSAWAEGERRNGSRALAGGGLALGAGITIKPHAAAFAVALAVVVAIVARRAGVSAGPAVATFVLGLTLVPLAALAWLAGLGALGAWREIVFDYLFPLYSRLARTRSWAFYRWHVWIAVGAAAVGSLAHAAAGRRFSVRHAVVALGLVYGLVHFFGQGKGWEYHLYPLAAFAAVATFSELEQAQRAGRRLVALPLIASLAVGLVLLGVKGTEAVNAGWIADKERRVNGLVGELRGRLRSGDLVQVLDTTEGGVRALLALRARQPSRFVYDFPFYHDVETPIVQGLRAELLGDLDARAPRFIVLFERGWPAGGYERIARFPGLERRLATRYRPIVDGDGYRIYAKRDDS